MTRKPAFIRSRTGTRSLTGPRSRTGFTLIELMIVIVIIAVLASILVPAVTAVLTRTRLATAKAEITGIGTAIADFESEFGKQPPSYIDFDVAGTGNLPPATKAILRSMFPNIDFNAALQTDLTKAGLWGKELYGPEALVFFLGGVRRGDGTTFSKELTGFSQNPANPFAQQTAGQSNRIGPFFEFDAGRLGEITRDPAAVPPSMTINLDPPPTEGLPLAYLDKLEGQGMPLLYVSTARTKSYVTADAGGVTYNAPNDDPDVGAIAWTPYKKSAESFYKPTEFQLISPGYDGEYGVGGVIAEGEAPEGDADNLTNFAEGPLGG